MNLAAVREECRVIVRKASEIDHEKWLKAGLPRGHGLAPTWSMARQMAALGEELLRVFRAQQESYARYIEEHPPVLAPVHKEATRYLPPEATQTYHAWLEGVTERREWGADEGARFALDRAELSAALREALAEAVGTGAEGARRALGALGPGFAPLGRTEARKLLGEIGAYATAASPEARAIYQAVAERAAGQAPRAAVLRDGAGRLLGAASYRTTADVLDVGHLGALEAQVPGTGVQLVRELAAMAAKEGRGIAVAAPPEAEGFFALGFVPDAEGRLRLAAKTAVQLAGDTAGPGPGWVRIGWLEGPPLTFTYGDAWAMYVRALQKELWEEWGVSGLGRGTAFAEKALDDAVGALAQTEHGRVARAEAELVRVALLRDKDGKIMAVAGYEIESERLRVNWLGTKLGAPAGTGRRMMRELATVAAQDHKGIVLQADPGAVAFYERLGMRNEDPGRELPHFTFTPKETAAFASGLTGPTSFGGQLSWELAVTGASDWLREVKIPGVVDEVSLTTHQALVEALASGLERGESTEQLARRVRRLDKVFGPVRAERIARTEVLTANRHGGYQMGKEAGCTEHEWRARIESPRTREWHASAHRQRVPYGQPYTVLNRKGEPEKLLYPGDRSLGAGADNTIQCRCSERRLKPGVTGDETLGVREYDLAAAPPAPGPMAAGVRVVVAGPRPGTR